MTFIKQTLVLTLLGCLLAMPSPVRASISITFEGDTPGSAPGVDPTPGNPMTQPSAIGGYTATTADNPPTAANGTILVGSAPGMAKGAIMTTNPANAVLGALWIDNNGFNLVGQQIRMSFDINVLAAPTVATTQPKILGSGTAGILLGMNTFLTSPSGGIGFRFAAAPTSVAGGVFAFRTPDNTALIDFFNYVEGQTYNVAIDANYTAGTLDAYVDGALKMSNYLFLPGGATGVNTGEFFFHLNGEAGYENSVAIDNIEADVAPEPTTLVVWGILSLCISAFALRSTKMQATS